MVHGVDMFVALFLGVVKQKFRNMDLASSFLWDIRCCLVTVLCSLSVMLPCIMYTIRCLDLGHFMVVGKFLFVTFQLYSDNLLQATEEIRLN